MSNSKRFPRPHRPFLPLLALLLLLSGGIAPASGRDWEALNTTDAPVPRGGHAMVWDSARGVMVLYGGGNGSSDPLLVGPPTPAVYNYDFNGSAWTWVLQSVGIGHRIGHGMVYDLARNRTVLFGGAGIDSRPAIASSDTQEWIVSQSRWSNLLPGYSPTARGFHAEVYDSSRDRVVLFGGSDQTGQPLDDTREFDGSNWAQMLPSVHPSARARHAMAYDLARRKTVLYGGNNRQFDTWEYDGTYWQQVTTANQPRAFQDMSMAYDPARGRVALLGGQVASNVTTNEFWEYDGTNWQQVPMATRPSARAFTAMAYDTDRGRLVAFGGYSGTTPPMYLNDVWVRHSFERADAPRVTSVSMPSSTIVSGAPQPFPVTVCFSAPVKASPAPTLSFVRTAGTGSAPLTVKLAPQGGRSQSVIFTGGIVAAPANNGSYRMTFAATSAFEVPLTEQPSTGNTLLVNISQSASGQALPLRIAAGTNPVLTFGGLNDAVPATSDVIEAIVEVTGLHLVDGTQVMLWIDRPVVGLDQTARVQVTAGVARFVGIPLNLGNSYPVWIVDAAGTVQATALFSQGGPPVARLRLTGANGGPQYVTLDATQSSSPRGVALTYRWQLTQRPDAAPVLDSGAAVVVYGAFQPGTYRFLLTVSEAGGANSTAAASLTILNARPIANAGRDRVLILPDPNNRVPPTLTGTRLVLDGRASRDPEGRAVTYSWELLDWPDEATLAVPFFSSTTAPVVVVTIPGTVGNDSELENAGEYVVRLTVSETGMAPLTSAALLKITAVDPNDLVPSADAGLDRVVEVTVTATAPVPVLAANLPDPTLPAGGRAARLRLDGRRSVEPKGLALSYTWTAVSTPGGGPWLALDQPASPTPSFVPTVSGEYVFQLVTANRRFVSTPDRVTIRVRAAAANSAPLADALIFDETRTRQGGPASPILTFTAEVDRVILDGSLSTDRETPGALHYQWAQTRGPLAVLAPSEQAATVSFIPPAPGSYGFRLTVTDPQGASSAVENLELVAAALGNKVPALALVALEANGPGVGSAVPEDPSARPEPSLDVMVNTTVVLRATATDPDVPARHGLVFSFTQLAGLPVLVTTRPAGDPMVSEVQFAPTTSSVLTFAARVEELTAGGEPTGVARVRTINVIVNSNQNDVPQARISLRTGPGKNGAWHRPGAGQPEAVLDLCGSIELSGDTSVDQGPNAAETLAYRWVQTAGPPIVLSDPFSVVTSFVVPDLGDDADRTYVFQLYVDDGSARSEPDQVSLEANPLATRTALVGLEPGVNLIAMPVRPGGAADPAASQVLTLLRASASVMPYAGLLPSTELAPESGFQFFRSGLGLADQPVQGNEGLLVVNTGGRVGLPVQGIPHASARRNRVLRQGLNLVSYTRLPPAGETVETLRVRAEASFVAWTDAGADGRSRFMLHLPGGQFPAPAMEGKAYLLSVPSSRMLTLPVCGQ